MLLACSVLILASLAAPAGDKKDKDKPALSGAWVLTGAEDRVFRQEGHEDLSPRRK
jgi:hypothetical protein